MTETVLIVSPHFDDEIIGCGGAILHHLASHDTVHVLYVTRGDCGDIRQGLSQEECSQVRHAESQQVMFSLGIETCRYLDFEEGFLRKTPELEKSIIEEVRACRPGVVYCPHPDEAHPDHRVVATITYDACKKASQAVFPQLGIPKHNLAEIRFYEVWTPMASFNTVLDITPYIDRKLQALALYTSQLVAVNYIDAIKGLNQYRGLMTTGVTYAEVFRLERLRPWCL